MRHCRKCGNKLEDVEIPSNKGWKDFDSSTGKRIIDEYKLCFNEHCEYGQINYCKFIKDGHKLVWYVKLAFYICLLGFLGGVITQKAEGLFFPLIAVLLVSVTDFKYCSCGYCKRGNEFHEEF